MELQLSGMQVQLSDKRGLNPTTENKTDFKIIINIAHQSVRKVKIENLRSLLCIIFSLEDGFRIRGRNAVENTKNVN